LERDRIRVVSIMEAQFVTGPAKNLLEFAQRAREGSPAVDLSVITYERSNGTSASANPFVEAAERAGVPVDIVHESRRFDRSIVPQIAGALERRAPDIVQTHNVKSHFLMRYSGLYRRYRWIAFHHGYVTTDLKMRAYNQLDRWSLRAPVHLVTVCAPFEQQLVNHGVASGRITVRHNAIKPFAAVEPERVAALRREFDIAEDVPVLLMVSRLSHEKGHVDCLEALSRLKSRGAAFRAVIVGEGPERGAIERAIDRLKLGSEVTLAGHQNDVRAYFGLASFFLMPSHSEGSPNALLEAMAAGVPIVASRVGGIPEIVENGRTGVLVEPRRPDLLADAIAQLIANPATARRLAENARAETARFTYEAYHRGLIEVYGRVLAMPMVRN